MTNAQFKRQIEKITGEKVETYIRHDGNNWYESQANCGNKVVYGWSEHYSRREATGAILAKLAAEI